LKSIVIDLDGTITVESEKSYSNKDVNVGVRQKLIEYKEMGYRIVILTARNMRTYDGNIGLINIHTLPLILEWLDKHSIPYDEVIVGKPWCGNNGFYVDDKAIRPSEFSSLTVKEIHKLLNNENNSINSGQ
jgi:capsule biosynthesis phosphatase